MKFKFYITVIIALLFFSCKEEKIDTSPYSIYFDIDLNYYPTLKNSLNAYILCPDNLYSKDGIWGSPAGLIVYHTPYDTYAVYDRCCRNSTCEAKIVAVVPDEDGNAVCPECKSKYLLFMGDGQVLSGSAKKALWIYPLPIERDNHLLVKYTAR